MVIFEEVSNTRKDFYQMMGPFFGSRKAALEIGNNIYDDNDKRWFCAFDGVYLVGFCSLRKKTVSDCYVVNEYRKRGILKSLLVFIQVSTTGKLIANCNSLSIGVFNDIGFKEKRKTKNFTLMEMNRA